MKILLLGGTGAMGIYLSEILSSEGHDVFVTTRKNRKHGKNITYICGNAHNINFLSSLLSTNRWDAIVDFMIYETQEFQVRAKLLLKSTFHYIFLSSSRVYADSPLPITEDCPRLLDVCQDKEYLATDEYALRKARQENILYQSGYKNWTIIRPYITFSEFRLQLGGMEKEFWLSRSLQNRPIVFSRDIAQHTTTMTYGYDVAYGIAAICCKQQAKCEAFHITGNQSFSWQSILEQYVEIIEQKLKHPVKVVMLEKSLQLAGNGKYQIIYDRYYDRYFNNSKIYKFMPPEKFHNSVETLKECLNKFLENPIFTEKNVKYDAKLDRICGIKIPLSDLTGWKEKLQYTLSRYILPIK